MEPRRATLIVVVALVLVVTACSPPAGSTSSSPTLGGSVPASSPARPPKPPKPPRPPKPPKPQKPPKPTPSAGGVTCPSDPKRGVYHSYRLHVLGTCRWYRGTVLYTRSEDDGDTHVVVKPDPGFSGFLDGDNYSLQHGGLVTEIIPGQQLPVPSAGEKVSIFGTWVYDADHGWNEIHPIWAIRYLSRGGTLRAALPPATPRYEPNAGGGSGGSGSGGGGSGCNPSYPTICLPAHGPDLDCSDIPYHNFPVKPPDPYHLDGDGDGVGCET